MDYEIAKFLALLCYSMSSVSGVVQTSPPIQITPNPNVAVVDKSHNLTPMNYLQPIREFIIVPQAQPVPLWRATATLTGENPEQGITGKVEFKQYSQFDPVIVTINATGLSTGKHGVHIHTYGDMTDGCKSTGPHFKRSLVGNIEAQGGLVSITFASPYLNLCGPNGIIGRSVVIHEKPIEYNRFPDIAPPPSESQEDYPQPPQTEEQRVGAIVSCGIITITKKKD